jgi:hypothetical protein
MGESASILTIALGDTLAIFLISFRLSYLFSQIQFPFYRAFGLPSSQVDHSSTSYWNNRFSGHHVSNFTFERKTMFQILLLQYQSR